MKIDLTLHDMERLIAGYTLEKSELSEKREELRAELINNKFVDEHYEDKVNVIDTRLMEVISRLMYFQILFEKRRDYINALNAIYDINNVKEPVPDYTEEALLKKLTSNQKES